MNGIHRVRNAIKRMPGAPVPMGELCIDRSFMEDYLKWRNLTPSAPKMTNAEILIECTQRLHLDLVCLQSKVGDTDSSVTPSPVSLIRPLEDSGRFVFWIVNGAFQTTLERQGILNVAQQITSAPGRIEKEMNHISQQVIATMAAGISAGAHGVIIADDIAHQQNTYFAPAFYEKNLLPLWQDQVRAAKDQNIPIFFHSDGNLNTILPTIAAAGFDGLQCIEPAAGMNIRSIKRDYGNNMCLMGNIDPSLLVDQTGVGKPDSRETLPNAIKTLLATATPGGGFIFGTCSGLYAGMSPKKVQQMYDEVLRISTAG